MTLPVVVVVDDAGAAVDVGKPKRVLSLAHFVFVAFFLTCGGPFGLESVRNVQLDGMCPHLNVCVSVCRRSKRAASC